MTNQPNDPQSQPRQLPSMGLVKDFINELRLAWRLMRDPRIPTWLKLIPPVSVAYVLFPLDFMPDIFVGLGQLDDLAALILGLRTFIEISPPDIVWEHRQAIAAESGHAPVPPGGQSVINGSWTAVDPSKRDPQSKP